MDTSSDTDSLDDEDDSFDDVEQCNTSFVHIILF